MSEQARKELHAMPSIETGANGFCDLCGELATYTAGQEQFCPRHIIDYIARGSKKLMELLEVLDS